MVRVKDEQMRKRPLTVLSIRKAKSPVIAQQKEEEKN